MPERVERMRGLGGGDILHRRQPSARHELRDRLHFLARARQTRQRLIETDRDGNAGSATSSTFARCAGIS